MFYRVKKKKKKRRKRDSHVVDSECFEALTMKFFVR